MPTYFRKGRGGGGAEDLRKPKGGKKEGERGVLYLLVEKGATTYSGRLHCSLHFYRDERKRKKREHSLFPFPRRGVGSTTASSFSEQDGTRSNPFPSKKKRRRGGGRGLSFRARKLASILQRKRLRKGGDFFPSKGRKTEGSQRVSLSSEMGRRRGQAGSCVTGKKGEGRKKERGGGVSILQSSGREKEKERSQPGSFVCPEGGKVGLKKVPSSWH